MRAVTMERVHNVERAMIIKYVRKTLDGTPSDVCYAAIVNGVINKKIVSFSDHQNFCEDIFIDSFIDELWHEHKNENVVIDAFDDHLMKDIGAHIIDVPNLNKRIGGMLL
jgi:hypothetical protein